MAKADNDLQRKSSPSTYTLAKTNSRSSKTIEQSRVIRSIKNTNDQQIIQSSDLLQSRMEQFKNFYQQKEYQKALDLAGEISKQDPKNLLVNYIQGNCLMFLG